MYSFVDYVFVWIYIGATPSSNEETAHISGTLLCWATGTNRAGGGNSCHSKTLIITKYFMLHFVMEVRKLS